MGKKNHQCANIDETENISENNFSIDVDARKAEIETEIGKKFVPKKEKSLLLSTVYKELDMEKRGSRVAMCGDMLEFHIKADKARLARANFCKDRLCPMCNWRRSLKVFGQVSQIMDVLEKKGFKFVFLTLTIKNCRTEDFSKTVQILMDGWRYLYHEDERFMESIEGTIRVLEVTRNWSTKEWHPHLHVVMAVKPEYLDKNGNTYITQEEYTEMWQRACGLEYKPIVDIERIYGKKGQTLKKAVAEISKYTVKSRDYLKGSMHFMKDNVSGLLFGLAKRRLIDFTGIFKQVRKDLQLDDVEEGNLVLATGEIRDDIAMMIVRYRWKAGVYMQM